MCNVYFVVTEHRLHPTYDSKLNAMVNINKLRTQPNIKVKKLKNTEENIEKLRYLSWLRYLRYIVFQKLSNQISLSQSFGTKVRYITGM